MDISTFLLIFEHPLRGMSLKGVKCTKVDKNDTGAKYFHFLGLFSFTLPSEMVELDETDEEKRFLLATLRSMINEGGRVYRKKYTQRVENKGKKKDQWAFEYFFDIVPANIMDYEIDKEKRTMRLVVKGYGTF